MKRLDMISANRPITEHQLRRLEGDLGIDLPMPYRQFLLDTNGGLPSECVFDIPGIGQGSLVFYGVETGKDYCDLQQAYRTYRSRLPDGVLPIGFDPGGNQVCLVLSGQHPGRVYFWDHEVEVTNRTLDSMPQLGANFGCFIDSLRFEDNEAW